MQLPFYIFSRCAVLALQRYEVQLNRAPSDAEITQLAEGVVITTLSQRDNARPVTAKTLPCRVLRSPRADNM